MLTYADHGSYHMIQAMFSEARLYNASNKPSQAAIAGDIPAQSGGS